MKRAHCAALLFTVVSLLFATVSCVAGKTPGESEEFAVRPLVWAVGVPLPDANDFFDQLPDGVTASFAKKDPFAELQMGENTVELLLRTPKKRAQRFQTTLTLVVDETPPEIFGVHDLIAYIGDGISYRSGITLTDNCGGEIRLTVDSSAVDNTVEGVYPVTYLATDLAGNTATATANVHIYTEEISPEMLNAEIDALIVDLGLRGMTKEAQVRAIFQFVHTDAKITYISTSDKTSWIREAYRCLMERDGDCFSYFALSKAFFERLGIENMDIQRLPGYTDDTHYWSLVNIAAPGESAKWYHYDATRLRDVPYSGALLTNAQIARFSELRSNFYLYDSTAYPATETKEITPRPDLQ